MFLDSRKWLKHSSKWGTQTQPRESERQLRTCNEVLVSICLKGRQSPLLLHTWAVNPPCDIWVSLKPLCFDLIHTDIYKSRPKASACAICRYVILWSKVANSAASALFPPMARASLYAMHIQDKISNTHRAILHRHDWTRLRVPYSTTFSASFFELPLTLKRHSPTFSCTLVLQLQHEIMLEIFRALKWIENIEISALYSALPQGRRIRRVFSMVIKCWS